MMEYNDLIKERYSIRKFSNREVEHEKIEQILEAGRIAPTACNAQPQRIYVLKTQEARNRIKNMSPFLYDAPIILMICFDENESWFGPENGHGAVDPTIVCTHMVLMATNVGLGSVWIGAFDVDRAIFEFNLPKNIIPIALIPIGYPTEDSKPNIRHGIRKPLLETVTYL